MAYNSTYYDHKRHELLGKRLDRCSTQEEQDAVIAAFNEEENARRSYLSRAEGDIKLLETAMFPSTVAGASCPDGMFEIDPDSLWDDLGFDVLIPMADLDDAEEQKLFRDPFKANDRWKGAPRSKSVYLRADPNNEDEKREDCLAMWTDLEAGHSHLPASGHPADLAIDRSLSTVDRAHNQRLGRKSPANAYHPGAYSGPHLWWPSTGD